MGEMIIIDPAWRGGKKFAIYRNPDSRDRRQILADDYKSSRFVLAGDGSLFAGQSYEFTHGDSHTALVSTFGANAYWSGQLVTMGPYFPISWGGILSPAVKKDDPRNAIVGARHNRDHGHVVAEWNPRGDICLGRMGHYLPRERGILDHSTAWMKFTRGLRISFPPIEPLEGFRMNEPVMPHSRCLVILHGDGHLYTFDHDMDVWDAEVALANAERKMTRGIHVTAPIVGMQLGGNGNAHILFSEVTQPIAFMMSNQNALAAFGGEMNFDISGNEKAIAT